MWWELFLAALFVSVIAGMVGGAIWFAIDSVRIGRAFREQDEGEQP